MRRGILVVLLLGVCGGPYQEAKKAGTSEALRDFAAANTNDPHFEEALERADQLDWDVAEKLDTEAGYRAYLAASPGGAHEAEANTRADALSWAQVTDATLRTHLERYPRCTHQFDGWRTLERRELELARQAGTLEALQDHFRRFPRNVTSVEVIGAIFAGTWAKLEPVMQGEAPGARMLKELHVVNPSQPVKAERLADYVRLAMLLEQLDLALQLSSLLEAYDPASSATWNQRAQLHRRLGDLEAEAHDLEMAASCNAPARQVIYDLARLRVRQGRIADARALLEPVIRVEATNWSNRDGAAPTVPNPDVAFYLSRAALFAAEGNELAWREYEVVLDGLPSLAPLLQVELIEDLRLDPLFAPLREDPRFQGLPKVVLPD